MNRGLELGLIRREALTDLDTTVEVDDLGKVVRLETVNEVRRRRLQRRQLLFHAGAAVQQQRESDWLLSAIEEGNFLFNAVLKHGELRWFQIGDVFVCAVYHRHVQ